MTGDITEKTFTIPFYKDQKLEEKIEALIQKVEDLERRLNNQENTIEYLETLSFRREFY